MSTSDAWPKPSSTSGSKRSHVEPVLPEHPPVFSREPHELERLRRQRPLSVVQINEPFPAVALAQVEIRQHLPPQRGQGDPHPRIPHTVINVPMSARHAHD